MSESNSDRYRPPSPLTSGIQLVSLAVVLLAAISMDIVLSHYVYEGNREIAAKHEGLVRDIEQIDHFSEVVARLSEAAQSDPLDEKEIAAIFSEVEARTPQVLSLPEDAAELPGETSELKRVLTDVEHAVARLNPRTHRGSQVKEAQELSDATAQVEQALQAQRGAVERLDETNLGGLNGFQKTRFWKNLFTAIAWLLNAFGFGYALQLFRRLRKEEQARFVIQSELAAERTALEKRVQARTAALEAEAKERQRAERLNRGRNRTLEMLARSEPAPEILKALASTVAEYRSTWICVIHAAEGNTLKLVGNSDLNAKLTQHFRSISTVFTGAPESIAFASGKPHTILDLGEERKPWSELLRANGLLSVWSAPFFAPKAEALGTLTVYARLKWEPSSTDIELLEMACHMAALVLERSQLQAQLIEHAYHDSLTGLPNRRLARDRIANAIKRADRSGQALAVLWIDLNRFKQINDQYGHPAGDAVLQQTARRLSERLRASDTLARMGGDEFMAILEGTATREAAKTIAVDLLSVLAQPMHIEELELDISASIGVSIYPEDGTSGDSLAQHADQAMYAAKFNRSGVCTFSPQLDREPAECELEAELSHGLENGGFAVVYQPLCQPDGTLWGLEALLRFHSPKLGNVPPDDFIPVAEETQLIVPLGEWVLREVCRQTRKWRAAGHPVVPVSVNISAQQFVSNDFADVVAAILSETGQPAEMLMLELAESTVMKDFDVSARQMERLKTLGVRIAIDDFGTGYSSLSYLHRLPIDVLKIDRSLMENLNEIKDTGPIVEAILSMAHVLKLGVVAKGVETDAQLGTLCRSGCDIVQGFLFSHPVQPDAAEEFLRSGRVEREVPVSTISVATPAH